MHQHAVLWIDHHHAKLLRLGADDAFETVAFEGSTGYQTHNKRHDDGHRHPLDPAYADRIAAALAASDEILLVGPSTAKDELRARLEAAHREVARRIVAVESADHPTDGELADHARRFFVRHDKMKGVHVR